MNFWPVSDKENVFNIIWNKIMCTWDTFTVCLKIKDCLSTDQNIPIWEMAMFLIMKKNNNEIILILLWPNCLMEFCCKLDAIFLTLFNAKNYYFGKWNLTCLSSFSGRNDKGQLGHGDTVRCDKPKVIESLKTQTIVQASCGKAHSLLLTGMEEQVF